MISYLMSLLLGQLLYNELLTIFIYVVIMMPSSSIHTIHGCETGHTNIIYDGIMPYSIIMDHALNQQDQTM